MSEWISVKDRLPKEDSVVLAYFDQETEVLVFIGGMFDGGSWRMAAEDAGITHWMPLPEPPK